MGEWGFPAGQARAGGEWCEVCLVWKLEGTPSSACPQSPWKNSLRQCMSEPFLCIMGLVYHSALIPSGPAYFEPWIQCFMIREGNDNTGTERKGAYPAHWQSQIFDSAQRHPVGWKLHRCRHQCRRAACWRLLLMHSLDLLQLLSCS